MWKRAFRFIRGVECKVFLFYVSSLTDGAFVFRRSVELLEYEALSRARQRRKFDTEIMFLLLSGFPCIQAKGGKFDGA